MKNRINYNIYKYLLIQYTCETCCVGDNFWEEIEINSQISKIKSGGCKHMLINFISNVEGNGKFKYSISFTCEKCKKNSIQTLFDNNSEEFDSCCTFGCCNKNEKNEIIFITVGGMLSSEKFEDTFVPAPSSDTNKNISSKTNNNLNNNKINNNKINNININNNINSINCRYENNNVINDVSINKNMAPMNMDMNKMSEYMSMYQMMMGNDLNNQMNYSMKIPQNNINESDITNNKKSSKSAEKKNIELIFISTDNNLKEYHTFVSGKNYLSKVIGDLMEQNPDMNNEDFKNLVAGGRKLNLFKTVEQNKLKNKDKIIIISQKDSK